MAIYYGNELYHYGVDGQKWGVRQYQNTDGSLTDLGRQHYGYGDARRNLDSAKANLKSAKKEVVKRNFLYGTVGHLTSKGKATDQAYKSAKAEYKQAKSDLKTAAIEKYAKLEKKADKAVEKADAAYVKKEEAYDNLGLFAGIKAKYGTSDAAQAYREAKAAAEKAEANAQAAWSDPELREAYKDTGSNFVSRIINVKNYYKSQEN